jgi:hypothetical protein
MTQGGSEGSFLFHQQYLHLLLTLLQSLVDRQNAAEHVMHDVACDNRYCIEFRDRRPRPELQLAELCHTIDGRYDRKG